MRFYSILILVFSILMTACSSNPTLELAIENKSVKKVEVMEKIETVKIVNAEKKIKRRRFKEASVHDPSIIKVDGSYYIVGSHLAFAKSEDLVNWKQLAVKVRKNNILFPTPNTSLKEVFSYAKTKTVWAGDIIKLKDGKYHYYFSACKGDQPLSVLGVATSDTVDGPYDDINVFLKSGSRESTYPRYNATVDPNVVDPAVFYDKDGKLWMVYGSYSGGIFILEMDDRTGLPIAGQKWGTKLLGGNHSRIEGPYIIYNKETDYYYLFLSYGGLDLTGGYNIRVVRSKNPNGPYFDTKGNNMIKCKGLKGTFFDDSTISKFGAKLVGNFSWEKKGTKIRSGYVSPGHNSNFYDKELGKYFIIFHTRFPNRRKGHRVRVHEMKFNSEAWPVILPFRYTAEESEKIEKIKGKFKIIFHDKDITAEIKTPITVDFEEDGTLKGKDIKGKWKINEENNIKLIIKGNKYFGFIEKQWNEYEDRYVRTFSLLSEDGTSVWGYQ